MRLELDPSQLTAEERLREIAVVFAAALRRLRDRIALPDQAETHPGPKNLPITSPEGLELPPETSVTVHGG